MQPSPAPRASHSTWRPCTSKDRAPARCWSKIKATGVCHTDAYTLRAPIPKASFPAILGHEGAGVVVEVGPGVTLGARAATTSSRSTRRNAASASTACTRKTNLCQAIRATQGKGLMPDGTSRFSSNGKPILHYMG